MKPAIRIENLSKAYQVGTRQKASYRTLRDSLAQTARTAWRLGRRAPGAGRPADDTFWALRDVSFEVRPGEVVGILGRNGAGKSTLLKVLSRITEPTSGRAELRGRVGSLLEVGTGFHPELTGRENIFLNGSILGMSRREIQRNFDAIVAFAEVERFLDTPVKRYSSGMYVRLAFAVAAYLEPEILVVDEVLAVGDMAFQKKCLGKMDQVSRSGRTVLFVSHNMAAVEGLCQRGVVLDAGRVACDDRAAAAIQAYYRMAQGPDEQNGHRFLHHGRKAAEEGFKITEVWVTSDGASYAGGFPTGTPLKFHLRCQSTRPVARPVVAIRIHKLGCGGVTKLHTERSGAQTPESVGGDFTVTCSVPDLLLGPGDYTLRVGLKSNNSTLDLIDDAAQFRVLPTDFFGTGRGQETGDGCVVCRQAWEFQPSAPKG